MHPTLKKGTKKFHNTSNFEEFLVFSIFYETKIPMVDMRV
jgi:hypothetical protein